MDATSSRHLLHGGDLADAAAVFDRPAADWLDLSTGINAEAYPDTAVAAESWTRLPQAGAMETVLAAARTYYRVPNGIALAAAAGSQALLPFLPDVVAGGRVAIVGPTYSEHERAWRARGYEVRGVPEIAAAGSSDIAVVTNPNNPDGRVVPPQELLALATALSAWRGLLVVDEAFADVAPEVSILPHLSPDHPVLVLRSFGKFFGLAGLRLGFAAGSPGLVERLVDRLGPWAVSGPALEIGHRALRDARWVTSARIRLSERRARLDAVLTTAGLEIVGGTDLFRLVEHADAPAVFRRLGHAGIFVRAFEDRPHRLRFGVPGSRAELDRLAAALAGPAVSQ